MADDLVQHRAAKVIPITDADQFFTSLKEKVAVQLDSQVSNPRTVGLLVATAKRYLGHAENRIQLHDLITDEHRRLTEALRDPDFSFQGGRITPEDFRHRVARYEALTEPLARIFGIAGRWGDHASEKLAANVFADIAYPNPAGGLTIWIDLHRYPAVLLLYAYGLGALSAGNYKRVLNWVTQPIRTDSGRAPAVDRLMLGAWDGGEDQNWRMLTGFERNRTPLSDRLHDIFLLWANDYALAGDQRTLLFETFEVLGSLAFLTAKVSTADLRAATASADPGFMFSPMGRAAWDSQARDRILSSLGEPLMQAELLGAGFSQGDQEHLQLALRNIRKLMARIGWR